MSIIAISILGGASFAFAITTPELKKTLSDRYMSGEILKVLIVPGHDDEFSGAKFRKEREADMTLSVAKQLANFLGQDPQLIVVVARDGGGYIPSLHNYFESQTLVVNEFIKSHSVQMKKDIASGNIIIPKQVPHGNASKIPLYRLYAINKWATEQDFDMVIHIHFNDEGSRYLTSPGKFSGYAVYVPDSNLLGAPASKELGTAIAKHLKRDFNLSNMSYEHNRSDEHGVVSDIKLIALGANKTIAIPRVLIEYSYIYEPIVSLKKFPLTSDIMAAATDYGIHDFLRGQR